MYYHKPWLLFLVPKCFLCDTMAYRSCRECRDDFNRKDELVYFCYSCNCLVSVIYLQLAAPK